MDWKERGEKGTLALHCFKKRHICHHSDSFALLGLRREEGETTTNAAWRSHLLAVFSDLVEREKGKGDFPGAHASVSLKSLLSWQQHMSPLSDAIGLHGRETCSFSPRSAELL